MSRRGRPTAKTWRSSATSRFILRVNLSKNILPLRCLLPATFFRETSDGTVLSVKLQPRASRNEIGAPLGDELKIKVTAPPVDAAANQALLELLAEKLDCPRGRVELIRGHTSRHKTILLHGFKPGDVLAKLSAGN